MRYVVSQFVTVSWSGGDVQITSPVARQTFTGDAALLQLLSTFAVPRTIDDAAQVQQWIDAAVLVDADVPEPAALQHWDRAALALHASSRDRTFRKTPGHSTPAVGPRRFATAVPLAPPGTRETAGLATLLDARRSRRAWVNTPIPFQAFSDLFHLSARNREVTRPYPSGGAAYSLELYPVLAIDAVETLDCGVYRYLPEAHALELVSPFDADASPFLVAAGRAAGSSPPPVAIVITSRYARQGEEYNRLAYSLMLKEVGALFQTLYLAAEALGLAACALGGGMPPGLLARLCRTTELEEPVVGEFMIGVSTGP